MKKKVALVLVAMVLVAALAVGGTMAWLTDTTGEVVNTFTVGNINIELKETLNADKNGDGTLDAWEVKLIPGKTYEKDPIVTVKANSEECYLFVEITETGSPATYLDFTYRLDGWTKLDVEGKTVYYRIVSSATQDTSYYLLTGGTTENPNGQVTVKETVGSTGNPLPTSSPVNISIAFKAYAIQKTGFETADAAWASLQAQIA